MTVILVILAVLVVLALIFGFMSVSAAILMWAWNLFLPLVWAAAPVLTFWPAFAAVVLLGFIGGIFRRTTIVKQD